MDGSDLIYRRPVEVGTYDVDNDFHATPAGVSSMLDMAGMGHLKAIGYPMQKMNETLSLGWALSQRIIRLHRPIHLGQTYEAETIVTGRKRIFTFRDYRVIDDQGQLCADSASIWILFDLKNRSFVRDYPPFFQELIDRGNAMPHLQRPQKLRFTITDSDLERYEVQVRQGHCDFLGHLSNYHHLRMIMDSLPISQVHELKTRAVNTTFVKEARLHDRLSFWVQQTGEGWLVEGRKGETVISKTEIIST